MNKFNIAFVFADKPMEFNTSNWRMIIPGKALSKIGYGVTLVPVQLFQEYTKDAEQACNQAQMIVIERNLVGDVITREAFFKVRGKVIILNWDDGYHAITEDNASYNYWKEGLVKILENGEEKTRYIFPHPFEQFTWGLRLGHAATLPSKQLVDYYSRYLPTYYLPNYFETEKYVGFPKEPRPYLTIGWGGSLSHVLSFQNSGVVEALRNICLIRPNVRLMICGDKRVYDKIEIPEDKKLFHNYVPYEEWGRLIGSSFDIGIAPLAGEYDYYRSWIKPLEYCLTKTPFVASNGPAYYELNKLGRIIDNSVDNWTKALLEIIDNYQEEKEKAEGYPYEFAMKQDINKNAENIAELYRLIARKHAFIEFEQPDS